MKNWMTLHQVMKMAITLQTQLDMTHAVCHSLQNIVLNVGDLQLDAVFYGSYGASFIPVLLQVAPRKEIRKCQVWQSSGPQVL